MAKQSRSVRFQLPVGPEAASLARERVKPLDDPFEGRWPDLPLLLSEVVTNVVRHSGLDRSDAMSVRLQVAKGRVRAEVTDRGRGLSVPVPPIEHPGHGAVAGYGLFLVDQLAARWGTLRGAATTVWFELPA